MSTILVVEDTLTDMQIVVSLLQNAGYVVVTASSEKEALERIASQKPDVIVMDIVLPDRSGFEICRDLKDNESTRKIPVVMCSSKGSNMDKYWGLQQGADAYLAKPVDTAELLKVIHKLA